jgi:phosphoribosylaminoimidazole-succinocarboxamide synthase
MTDVIDSIEIPGLTKFISGKVREVFDLGDKLLVVATDRLSAFDVILPTGIPNKGRVLTQVSQFWLEQTKEIVADHLESVDVDVISQAAALAGGHVDGSLKKALSGRSMLVKKAKAFPIECVVRGYISGSLWKEYKSYPAHGGEITLHGEKLAVGLRESDKLPVPIFTPSTKASSGHDEPIDFAGAAALVGEDYASQLKDLSIAIYSKAAEHAKSRGIIIADTKFEFGLLDGKIILIDEVLTPDSSRFWDEKRYKPGGSQDSFDKQYVRDYLETLDWGKTYPGPELPEDVVAKTSEKYIDAYRRISGKELTV